MRTTYGTSLVRLLCSILALIVICSQASFAACTTSTAPTVTSNVILLAAINLSLPEAV
jgi:hypothetical protein